MTSMRVQRRASARRRPASPWPGFLWRRAVTLVFAVWASCTLVFFVTALSPFDPVRAAAGVSATAEYVAARRAELGLDDPILVRYARFLFDALRLDFGSTLSTSQPVSDVIAQRFPYTLTLGLLCFAIVTTVGLAIGMLVAQRTVSRPGSRVAAVFDGITGVLVVIPDYLIAVALILVFSVSLRLLPAAGGHGAQAYILPAASISIGLIAVFARLVRTETARVLREDYLRTARANRIPRMRQMLAHVLPNVATSTLTFGGLMLAGLLSGMVIAETVFDFPGIGSLLVQAITLQDQNLMVGIVLIIATIALIVNILVDVLLAVLDPKSMIVRS